MRFIGMSIVLMSVVFTFLTCATSGVNPEDMSYQQHKEMAEKEKLDAEAAQKKADENQDVYYVGGSNEESFATGVGSAKISPWQDRADMDEQLAREHLAAAEALKNNVIKECGGVPHTESCPLMSNEAKLVSVKKIDNGIEVVFPVGFEENRQTVEQEARCHFAQGAFVARKGMPGCPLFNKALVISSKDNADGSFTVTIASDNPQSVQGLHAWSDVINAPKK